MFSIGIVGLPNVGKSTLFSALTGAQVDCANYPFCTIEPNKAIVAVPDDRLEKLAVQEKSAKILPTTIEFVDIAGLVAGAHKGEGLGNKFLANIREVDALVHVVRAFENSDIAHVTGRIHPDDDKQIIILELILSDLEYIEKLIFGISKKAKSDKEAKEKLEVLEKIKEFLESEKMVSDIGLDIKELLLIKEFQFLTSKPLITVANVSDNTSEYKIGQENTLAINIKVEQEISQLEASERPEFLAEMGLSKSGLERLIESSYKLLNLITFITAGPTETRAWTVKNGSKAPQAAGVIHTDFEKGFIKAEIIQWHKLLEAGGYVVARDRGWIRLEGKDYVISDGDVVHFKFNV